MKMVKNLKKEKIIERSTPKEKTFLDYSSIIKSIFTILAIIVAIGAYSVDSLFVRFFSSDQIYSTVRVTSMGGTKNTGIYRSYSSAYGEVLAPVQMLMYLNIRNESKFDQIVEGILIEIQDENKNWMPVTSLDEANGIYTAMGRNGLKESILLDFSSQNLLVNLGQGRIKPRDVISGWLFLEFPSLFHKKNVLMEKYQITIFSGFGERETHLISVVDLPENANQTRIASFRPLKPKRDLSNKMIISQEDLRNSFKKKKNAN